MRALIDTHALLWWVADSARLSETARAAIADESHDIFVSAASAWELATKFRLGKLPGGEHVAADVVACIASQGFLELEISVADAERAGRLAGAHRDPFDRMLIAQALAHDLRIVSVDRVFDDYVVDRVWGSVRSSGPEGAWLQRCSLTVRGGEVRGALRRRLAWPTFPQPKELRHGSADSPLAARPTSSRP